jgi:transmembrane sensor
MSDSIDWQLLDRWLAGEATDADDAAVRAWIAANPKRAELLADMRERVLPHDAARYDVDAAWRRLAPRLDESATVRPIHPRVAPPLPARHVAWRAAAAVLLVAGGAAAAWRLATSRHDAPAVAAMREATAPIGRRGAVTLDDGSRVQLAAGSRLRWRAGLAGARRELWLEGEGYFEAAHDPSRPFLVHAGDAVVHDIGTRFVVRGYPELAHVEVLVTAGAVSLRRDATGADSALLRAGALGRLDAGALAPSVREGADTAAFVGWTRGSLVLDGETLEEAIPRLERWFDVRIVVADPALRGRAIAARFGRERAAEALDALALVLGARVERAGRTATFTANAPEAR